MTMESTTEAIRREISSFRAIRYEREEILHDQYWVRNVLVDAGQRVAVNPNDIIAHLRTALALLQMRYLPTQPDPIDMAVPALQNCVRLFPCAELNQLLQETTAEADRRHMKHIPNEILAEIFKNLGVRERMRVEVVSKRWNAVIKAHCWSGWTTLSYSDFFLHESEDEYRAKLQVPVGKLNSVLARGGRFLKGVDLSSIEVIPDTQLNPLLSSIAQTCTSLEHISLARISEERIYNELIALPNLVSVRLFDPIGYRHSFWSTPPELPAVARFFEALSSRRQMTSFITYSVLPLDMICAAINNCRRLTHIAWKWNPALIVDFRPLFEVLDQCNETDGVQRKLHLLVINPLDWQNPFVFGSTAPQHPNVIFHENSLLSPEEERLNLAKKLDPIAGMRRWH